jgi:hypothetical protein
MSAKDAELEADEMMMSHCASCGVAGGDDIKLKECTSCHLVRYCSEECREDHQSQHEEECKKRAAELHDELLFKQPKSTYLGDCPICCVPLPLDTTDKATLMPCCSKLICDGCRRADWLGQIEGRREMTCPFCRHPVSTSQAEADRYLMKRFEANDPVALREMGARCDEKRDYIGAFEYFTKATELGDVLAHYQLSWLYKDGKGVEKDEKKERYHLEQAAISGHPGARHNLGLFEWNHGQNERAARHFIIAANLGHDNSLRAVTKLYRDGFVSKDDFASTLRAHKAAVDAMKSPDREAAEEAARTMSYGT